MMQSLISQSSTVLCGFHIEKSLLEAYQEYLKEITQNYVGYPFNSTYDYSQFFSFLNFSINNVGDPFIESNYKVNSHLFEQGVLAFFAQLYQAKDWWGYVTGSGTEGNLYGLLLGQETYPDGILYASADSHSSIPKAARFFKIPHVVVRSQENGEMDYQDLESKLDPNCPAIINVNIGTTGKGAVDNLDHILEALDARGIERFYIHCDGSLGGMLLPYLQPGWVNFNRPIHSLAISGHKFIGCPFPCGIVLTHKAFVDRLVNNIEFIGSRDTTLSGSRNGHAPLFLYYAIQQRKHLFEQEVRSCIDKATYLHKRITSTGRHSLLNPYSTSVVFEQPQAAIAQKWQLATLGNLAYVVVMQNHSYELLDRLCADLIES